MEESQLESEVETKHTRRFKFRVQDLLPRKMMHRGVDQHMGRDRTDKKCKLSGTVPNYSNSHAVEEGA